MQIPHNQRFKNPFIIFSLITILNFLVFVTISSFIGGDAVNGKVVGEHYYLWGYSVEAGSKTYTEVSKDLFLYSKWHVYSIFLTWPIMLVWSFTRNRENKRHPEDSNVIGIQR